MSIHSVVNQGNNMISAAGVKENSAVKSNDKIVQNEAMGGEVASGYMPNVQEKTVIDAIEKANKKLERVESELEFSIHEKTKQIMVKVVNKSTKEVVREIPSEKVLDMVAAMCESVGLFVDEKL